MIRYIPGPQNEAADTMSRIIASIPPKESTNVKENELPPGFRLIEKIDGGGDTMFQSLLVVLKDLSELHTELVIPDNHVDLRRDLVECLIENHTKFKLKLTKEKSKFLKAMKHPNTLPSEEVLLAACFLYKVEVWVHHGMKSPITYRLDDKVPADGNNRIIHLQCIAGIHFNPVMEVHRNGKLEVKNKNVNVLMLKEEREAEEYHREDSVSHLINVQVEKAIEFCNCEHSRKREFCKYVASVAGVSFCALVDTGAQVSAISEALWERIKDKTSATLEEPENLLIYGVGKKEATILGIVRLKLKLLDMDVSSEIPFAVLGLNDMPCCAILGANFISKNQIAIDFDGQMLYCENEAGEQLIYPFQEETNVGTKTEYFHGFIGQEIRSSSEESQDMTYDSDQDHDSINARNVRYVIHNNKIADLQNHDHALSSLKNKLIMKQPSNKWKEPYLKQFRRYCSELEVVDD